MVTSTCVLSLQYIPDGSMKPARLDRAPLHSAIAMNATRSSIEEDQLSSSLNSVSVCCALIIFAAIRSISIERIHLLKMQAIIRCATNFVYSCMLSLRALRIIVSLETAASDWEWSILFGSCFGELQLLCSREHSSLP